MKKKGAGKDNKGDILREGQREYVPLKIPILMLKRVVYCSICSAVTSSETSRL